MSSRRAFTLLELSIVLVILGLLVGGVLAGQSVLESSRLGNILADAQSYSAAIQQFSDKYGALPGDMRDAQRIWGNAEGASVDTDCATPAASASVGALTCNGNGNGIIGETGAEYESFRAWQQLAAANYVHGTFSGIAGAGGNVHAVAGSNVPQGALEGTAYFIGNAGVLSGDATYFDGDYTNRLLAGRSVDNAAPTAAAFSPQQAYDLDKKVDDGLPGLGSVLAQKTDCATTTDATTAKYALSLTTAACVLHFTKTFQPKNM